LYDVYGDDTKGRTLGFGQMMEALNQHYRNTTDAALVYLSQQYGAAYAVLYSDTAVQAPLLARSGNYELVRIDPPGRPAAAAPAPAR
jgi:hypothetical protein